MNKMTKFSHLIYDRHVISVNSMDPDQAWSGSKQLIAKAEQDFQDCIANLLTKLMGMPFLHWCCIFWIYLFVLILSIPVNNLSVMLGQVFLVLSRG